MSRTDRLTNERTTVRPEPAEQKPGDTTGQYRFNWDTAMQLSPFDPATIYIGANMVLKSSDRGRSYQPISPTSRPTPIAKRCRSWASSARTSSWPSTTASARSATSSRSKNPRRSRAWCGSAATTASSA